MKKIFLILSLFICNSLFCQENEYKEIFLDSELNETAEENALYYAHLNSYQIDELYDYTIFFNSGKTYQTGKSTSNLKINRAGNITSFFENGNKEEEYLIIGSFKTGIASSWYENGNKKLIAEYYKESKELVPPQKKILAFWDSNNTQKVIDGNGEYDSEEELCREKGIVKNGFKIGKWTGYDIRQKLNFIETYENGTLISGESTHETGEKFTYTRVFAPAKPRKGYEHFYQYISDKFSFTRKSRNKSGKMLFTFVIDKNGSVSNIQILKRADEELEEEAIRLIKNYPDWSPGFYRGKPVRVSFAIPITIKP